MLAMTCADKTSSMNRSLKRLGNWLLLWRMFPRFYRLAHWPGRSRWASFRAVLEVVYGIPRLKKFWRVDRLVGMLRARPRVAPHCTRRFVFGVWWRHA